MRKTVKFVISNDWHLQSRNIDQIKDLVDQKISLCKELDCKKVIIAGDVFESRVSQREDVLNAFSDILYKFYYDEIEVFVIVGNHDKTVYTSRTSFLDQYKHHPLVYVIDEEQEVDDVWMVPFYTDEILSGIIPKGRKGKVLVSHFAVSGSRNNDGTIVSEGLSQQLFKNYDVVLLGHYHNHQTIGKNIVHMPSLQQNNYGEDNNKGFTVLYEDHSWEIVKSNFKEFVKTSINVDELSKKEISEIVSKLNPENNNRVELIGCKAKLKAYNESDFATRGIALKKKDVEIEVIDSVPDIDFREVTESDILKCFKEFCEEKGYNEQEGVSFLKRK